jgi:hypothetical protein
VTLTAKKKAAQKPLKLKNNQLSVCVKKPLHLGGVFLFPGIGSTNKPLALRFGCLDQGIAGLLGSSDTHFLQNGLYKRDGETGVIRNLPSIHPSIQTSINPFAISKIAGK